MHSILFWPRLCLIEARLWSATPAWALITMTATDKAPNPVPATLTPVRWWWAMTVSLPFLEGVSISFCSFSFYLLLFRQHLHYGFVFVLPACTWLCVTVFAEIRPAVVWRNVPTCRRFEGFFFFFWRMKLFASTWQIPLIRIPCGASA